MTAESGVGPESEIDPRISPRYIAPLHLTSSGANL
jgi:hypothetical protein